jgi:hypothetical protein
VQVGNSGSTFGTAVSADQSGNSYLGGYTTLRPQGGRRDGFLTKFDSEGALLWSTTINSSQDDATLAVSVDWDGNALVAGRTTGQLGETSAGAVDAFVAKYDTNGALHWTQQFGTEQDDEIHGLGTDRAGNVFAVGTTRGALAIPNDSHSQDVFVAKFGPTGLPLWTRQFGAIGLDDVGTGIASDDLGNIYVTGTTWGKLGTIQGGGPDAFLSKFDTDGNPAWVVQIGTSAPDFSYSVEADGIGNVFIAGQTLGDLAGANPSADYDAFLLKYDPMGELLSARQFSTIRNDQAFDVALDDAGNAYLVGITEGQLGAAGFGDVDAFVLRVSASTPIPEPNVMLLFLIGLQMIATGRGSNAVFRARHRLPQTTIYSAHLERESRVEGLRRNLVLRALGLRAAGVIWDVA